MLENSRRDFRTRQKCDCVSLSYSRKELGSSCIFSQFYTEVPIEQRYSFYHLLSSSISV